MTTAQSPAQSRITITADDGFPIRGTWQTRSGGTRSAPERREREGGELFKEEVGAGPGSTETTVLSRSYKRERDVQLLRWAHRNAGLVMLTITEVELDEEGNAAPGVAPMVDRGRLLACNRPEVDANNVTGFKRIEFTVATTGEIG